MSSEAESKYVEYGFDACEFEPGECDRCCKVAALYFGDRDYWDSREGTYLCSECLDQRIAADAIFLNRPQVDGADRWEN